jgi:hypothetical protein
MKNFKTRLVHGNDGHLKSMEIELPFLSELNKRICSQCFRDDLALKNNLEKKRKRQMKKNDSKINEVDQRMKPNSRPNLTNTNVEKEEEVIQLEINNLESKTLKTCEVVDDVIDSLSGQRLPDNSGECSSEVLPMDIDVGEEEQRAGLYFLLR